MFEDTYNRFDRIPEYGRVTDRQTDRHLAKPESALLCIASRGKNGLTSTTTSRACDRQRYQFTLHTALSDVSGNDHTDSHWLRHWTCDACPVFRWCHRVMCQLIHWLPIRQRIVYIGNPDTPPLEVFPAEITPQLKYPRRHPSGSDRVRSKG